MGKRVLRVSVVLMRRDRAQWVWQGVSSVLAQAVQEYGLVIVDDGSVDETPALLRDLAAADSRVVVVNGGGQGIAHAVAVGVAASSAALVSLLADDDEYFPTFVETMAKALDDALEVDAVYSDYLAEFRDSIFGGTAGQMVEMRPGPPGELPSRNVVWGCMFRRAMYDRIGGWPQETDIASDWQFWLTAYANGARLAQVREPLYLYRYWMGGSTFQRRAQQLAEAAQIGEWYRAGALRKT